MVSFIFCHVVVADRDPVLRDVVQYGAMFRVPGNVEVQGGNLTVWPEEDVAAMWIAAERESLMIL